MSEAMIRLLEENNRQKEESFRNEMQNRMNNTLIRAPSDINYVDYVNLRGLDHRDNEELARLRAKAKTIDLARVGHLSVTKPKYISGRLMAAYCKIVIAQGLFDCLQTNENGLVLRDFTQNLDLVDVNDNTIQSTAWRQPVTGNYDLLNHDFRVYEMNRYCENDRKVSLVYGIMNTDYSKKACADRLSVWAYNVKCYDNIDLTSIRDPAHTGVSIHFFQKPLLCIRLNDIGFRFHTADEFPITSNAFDRYRLLGITVEPAGYSMCG